MIKNTFLDGLRWHTEESAYDIIDGVAERVACLEMDEGNDDTVEQDDEQYKGDDVKKEAFSPEDSDCKEESGIPAVTKEAVEQAVSEFEEDGFKEGVGVEGLELSKDEGNISFR